MRAKDELKIKADYIATFDNVRGQAVLDDLSKLCFEHQTTYVDQNPSGTAHREGMRRVLLYIRRKLETNPDKEKQQTAKE